MKRALPSYDDLVNEPETEQVEQVEEGEIEDEIIEDKDAASASTVQLNENEDFGIKAVLPVGKFNEKFKEGDFPSSGEDYLCTVKHERSKLAHVLKAEIIDTESDSEKRVTVNDLYKNKIEKMEIEAKWAQTYWNCYKKSEETFLDSISKTEVDLDSYDDSFLNLKSAQVFKKMYETREIEPNLNFLSFLRANQDFAEKMICWHKVWLEGSAFDLESASVKELLATWLQALLMCLDSRLTSLQISNLRQLILLLDRNEIEFREIVLVVAYKYGQSDLIEIVKSK